MNLSIRIIRNASCVRRHHGLHLNLNIHSTKSLTTNSSNIYKRRSYSSAKIHSNNNSNQHNHYQRLVGRRQKSSSTASATNPSPSLRTPFLSLKSFSASSSSPSSTTTVIRNSNIQQLKDALQIALLQPRTIPIPRWISPRSYSFALSECFGHASFVLVAVSYATDDFLLLRIIAVAGSTCMLFFTYFHPHGRILWLPFQWNVLFILINSYRIGLSLYYKYIGHFVLSEDMKNVKKEYFDIMDMSDFVELVSIAEEEVLSDGQIVAFQGQKNRYIRMVIEGELDVLRDGIKTYTLEEGNFVTEAGLHAGLYLKGVIESCCTIASRTRELPNEKEQPSVVEKSTIKTTRCLRWDRTELINLLKNNKGIRRSLKAILSWDIVRKLKGQRQDLAEHKVENPEFWTQKRQEQSEDRYAAILQNMLQHPDYFKKRKVELDHYRTVHHIDDEHHRLALKKCGWTVEEYQNGEKFLQEFDEDNYDDYDESS